MWETVWTFNTRRFTINLDVAPEDTSPEGQFCEDDDVKFAREGGWHWFQARIQVIYRDDDNPKHWVVPRRLVLGENYLGGCSYHSLEDFIAPGSGYFRDMVHEAVREAKEKIARISA